MQRLTHANDAPVDSGEYPGWTLCVQIMTEEHARGSPFNPFDLTEVWPHAAYPLHEVGTLELNRNPENYFADPDYGVADALRRFAATRN